MHADLCSEFFGDLVNELAAKMSEADGILIGSPVYFASPNGTLLALLDRLFYSSLHKDWTMKVGASCSYFCLMKFLMTSAEVPISSV